MEKNYDNFIENAKKLQLTYGANGFGEGKQQKTDPSPSAASAYEAALSTWQKSIQELLGYFYKSQIEAYRLLSNHWEQYLKLHAEISQSRSLTEFTQPVIKVKPNGTGDPNA